MLNEDTLFELRQMENRLWEIIEQNDIGCGNPLSDAWLIIYNYLAGLLSNEIDE